MVDGSMTPSVPSYFVTCNRCGATVSARVDRTTINILIDR